MVTFKDSMNLRKSSKVQLFLHGPFSTETEATATPVTEKMDYRLIISFAISIQPYVLLFNRHKGTIVK